MCTVCASAYDRLAAVLSHPPSLPRGNSCFLSHTWIPDAAKKMFRSLIVVFPTPHEGSALITRHRGQERAFDSAAALSTAPPSSIGYAAFFSDVKHGGVRPLRDIDVQPLLR
jgi:hypothetical protein